jgi:hypothetical protein
MPKRNQAEFLILICAQLKVARGCTKCSTILAKPFIVSTSDGLEENYFSQNEATGIPHQIAL